MLGQKVRLIKELRAKEAINSMNPNICSQKPLLWIQTIDEYLSTDLIVGKN